MMLNYKQITRNFSKENRILEDSDEANKDLYTEQVLFCQMLGVDRCFDRKLMQLILKWQDKEIGCWKDEAVNEQRNTLNYDNLFQMDELEFQSQALRYDCII